VLKWKVLAGIGGFTFILSLLVGLASGVAFATLIFRALISGVVFSGIVLGAGVLIEKYLPELWSLIVSEESGKSEGGGGVDIVIPAEDPYSAEEKNEEGEETKEILQSGLEVEEKVQEDTVNEISSEFVEEMEELGGNLNGEEELKEKNKKDKNLQEDSIIHDIDTLPDIETFSDSFSPLKEEGKPKSFSGVSEGKKGMSGGRGVDTFIERQDPLSIAKAIQTIMKKDQ